MAKSSAVVNTGAVVRTADNEAVYTTLFEAIKATGTSDQPSF